MLIFLFCFTYYVWTYPEIIVMCFMVLYSTGRCEAPCNSGATEIKFTFSLTSQIQIVRNKASEIQCEQLCDCHVWM